MTGPDGGDAILEAFTAAGVEYVFSSPGSEWAPVWESLARRHRDGLPGPHYLDLMHETVAVGMATGYALVTRRAQAVLLHAGPGLLQGACAVHGALLAGVPMVVASSESTTYGDGPGPDPGGQWYRNLSVVGGPHTMAQPFVKWASQVGSVHTLAAMVTRAAALATQAPAGPTYLNVPLEVLLEPWSARDLRPLAGRGGTVSAPDDLATAAGMIAAAAHPVVVTETAGREAGGMAALVAFAEAYGVPVVEPQSAVCANFPRTHALHAGEDLEPFLDTADLIILVNCRAPFYPPSRRPAHARILVIDEVPQRPHLAYQVVPADHLVAGSVPAALRSLAASAPPATRSLPPRSKSADEAEARAEGLDPIAVAAALRTLLADDDPIVVDETITHSRVVSRHLRRGTEDSYFYVQGGLGQGIAVALGVRLAAPDRPVVLTVGDGAFLYNPVIPSLQAARANGLPLLIVIFNNHQYRSMKMNHLRFYPRGAAVQTGEFLGADLSGQPELASFAEPFGMHSETVREAGELSAALDRALKSVRNGTTAIVDVHVSR